MIPHTFDIVIFYPLVIDFMELYSNSTQNEYVQMKRKRRVTRNPNPLQSEKLSYVSIPGRRATPYYYSDPHSREGILRHSLMFLF
ncbi:hypothetical protein VTN77DRAFT_2053 [Rasamsonia byssochlamydoides]|uniref:uncharacterized protein n=1 Tax=Rasamsonia byssochlamydoides TaxID=89139 RepID=UPI003744778F